MPGMLASYVQRMPPTVLMLIALIRLSGYRVQMIESASRSWSSTMQALFSNLMVILLPEDVVQEDGTVPSSV